MSLRLISPSPSFGPAAIDRTHRLSFRLDDMDVAGFAGDTVLSALMGAGITEAGQIEESRLRLGTQFAPFVRRAADKTDPGVPMELCPVMDGADLVTVGAHISLIERLAIGIAKKPRTGLGVDFGSGSPTNGFDKSTFVETKTDIVIIGGGVAGMQAAIAGVESGRKVVLVEQRGRLGGDAALFGNREGEKPVLETVTTLQSLVASRPEIELRLLCRATDAGDHGVTVTSVTTDSDHLACRVERISAPRIVLATGCADRIPVYPGNRLPGVIGLAEAFDLAATYGVWSRGPVLFVGGSNPLYHLAMMAKDSGGGVLRLIDYRPEPHSRFIDFAKASGIHQEFGTRIAEAYLNTDRSLTVHTELVWQGMRDKHYGELVAGSVVQSNGWCPRLRLWSCLGGPIGWTVSGEIAAKATIIDGVALAGSAAGLLTTHGCQLSGEQAIAALDGKPRRPIDENRLADYIESPDADALDARPSGDELAFLGTSRVLVAMPRKDTGRTTRRHTRLIDPDTAGVLDLDTINALTRAGLTPSQNHADICAERLVLPEVVTAKDWVPARSVEAKDEIPAYLAARFTKAAIVSLRADDGRRFEPGMLVFAESGLSRPDQAIGVIVSAAADGGKALLTRPDDDRVNVRDGNRSISAVITD